MKRVVFCICAFLGASIPAFSGQQLENLSLQEAVKIALENHRSLQVSQAVLNIAEAQYQQAMAAFGPRLGLEAGFQRADQDRTFDFNGVVQTPAMVVMPGVVIPSQPLTMNLNVKMFDRDVSKAALNFSYPLYTGGKEAAIKGMASKGVDIAREEKRKTELEVVRDVSKYYSGARLAQQMEKLTSETLERFQALEDLTDRLYQNASLKVKKTDYLRSKTTTAITSSLLQEAKYAGELSRDALVNALGLPLNTAISFAPEVAVPELGGDLDALIEEATAFNPDKQRLELAVQAADYQIDEAKSGHLPTVGLEASTYRVWNGFKGGLFNDDNRTGWTIGIGMKWDLYDGGLTRSSVDAARAGKIRLEQQRVLLDSGLALQIKNEFMRIRRSRAQVGDNNNAQRYAEENRKLNVRAYQEEMVETKDVIEAHIVETFATANLYRAQHELRSALADLDFLVGRVSQEKTP